MVFLKIIILIITTINTLYIYEKDTNTYLGSFKNNESVIATKNLEYATNFEFIPTSIAKTYLISKGNGFVIDLPQFKVKNKLIFWKKHGKINQQVKIIDISTNSIILFEYINDYQEYKIMINNMCAYVKEITFNNYQVYVRSCNINSPGGIFKIVHDKYINNHMVSNEASALHHYQREYLNNPITSIPHISTEAITMNLETLPLEEKYLKQKHYNLVTMTTPRNHITSESYIPVYNKNHKLITTPTEELITPHSLQHDNFHFNHARNALERHLIKNHNYIID